MRRFVVVAGAVLASALMLAGSLTAVAETAGTVSAPAGCAHPRYVSSAPFAGWGKNQYVVTNNMWNAGNYSVTQTLHVCSAQSWYVVADMNNDAHDGAVKTYPNVQETFNEQRISSFHTITSTFAETSPHTGIYEDAYDIWINGIASPHSFEVMIWNDNWHQVPAGSIEAWVKLGGRTYAVWRDPKARGYIAFVATKTFYHGTMNLLQMFDWLMARGWMPKNSTLGQIDYGTEIVSTNNVPRTFAFSDFSVDAS
jgi:hypothetical protein